MKNFLGILFVMLTFVFANYNVGDFISESDQNLTKSTCYSGNGYEINDNWKLSDWNGALNGGDYNVIFLEMSATWWGSCWTGHNGPAGYEHQDYEENSSVKFVTGLADLNQPYSCSQWGNAPDGGGSQIVHDTGYNLHTLYNLDNYFPSTIFITHEMQVYDKMNNAGSWSIGSRIDQMLEDCGALCDGEGGCATAAGDLNEDEILNIQDLITMVNHILGSSIVEGCSLEAADMNVDGIINIQDLISLVNAILGAARSADLDGHAQVVYIKSGKDLIVRVEADTDIAGIELSLLNGSQLDVILKDNSHLSQDSYYKDGITRYLAYSMFNQPFDSRTVEFLINSAADINMDDISITIGDVNGDAFSINHTKGSNNYYSGPYAFELDMLYPNPFNPSTEVKFSLPHDSHVKLSAYDVKGQEVDLIFEGVQSLGQHSYTWNAANLPSGVYYVRLQAGDLASMQKALLIK